VKKLAHKEYGIEYYLHGKRGRELIGPPKAATEQRLREVLKARTEERYIDKDQAARITLGEPFTWYKSLSEEQPFDNKIKGLLYYFLLLSGMEEVRC
jgi:hypothetical protein